MRILHISSKYEPHVGGVEKHVHEIVEIQKKRHNVVVLTEKHSECLPGIEYISKIQIIRIPILKNRSYIKKFIVWFWILKNLKFIYSFDVIHVHDVLYWLYPIFLFPKRKKIILTLHGWEGKYPIPKRSVIQKKFNVKIATASVAVGEFINKWFDVKTDKVTYGGVRINHKSKKKLLNPNTLLFLGRLEEDTGFQECIDLYRKLKDQMNWNLTVIGDGALKNKLTTDISYLGVQRNPEQYIADAKWVFTTGYLGILETLSCGKPIICRYKNPVKEDYLKLHPMAKYFCFDENIPDTLPVDATDWAKQQTWEKIADTYNELYTKNNKS